MQNQLHIVADSSGSSGGEGLAASRYAESIARAGCMVTLLSKYNSGRCVQKSGEPENFEEMVFPTRGSILFSLWAKYDFIAKLCKYKKIDIIHIHGVWTPFLAIGALVANRSGLPLVISPHGCLNPVALGYKRYKKIFALKLYQGFVLRSASLFVATANQEAENMRRLGLHQPVAIIPNGVDVDVVPRQHNHAEIKTILFLSRIHPIKGLMDLVEAWADVRRPGWRIVIAGEGDQGYCSKVEELIRVKSIESDFEFIGFVDGERKQACFDSADIFVLPTYSENFGIVIAEALASELPVITTTGAPWHELLEYHCGWWVPSGVQGIRNALREAISCEPAELREMGKRGRQLMLDKYSWDKIGDTALEVSEWVLDRSRPIPYVVKEYVQ